MIMDLLENFFGIRILNLEKRPSDNISWDSAPSLAELPCLRCTATLCNAGSLGLP